LAEAAAFGAFFAVEVGATVAGWEPFAELVEDVRRVTTIVGRVRLRLAARAGVAASAVETRAAASTWHLGMTARLMSPAVGAIVAGGWMPDLRGDVLRWRGDDGQPVPLGVAAALGARIEPGDDGMGELDVLLVQPLIRPLTQTVERAAAVSSRVLWGNVWSALVGAAAVIARSSPALAADAGSLARAALSTPGRDLAGRFDDVGRYRRETCCLYYRLPGGGLCGDCVLA
jgi:hypothetical protein